MQQKIVTYEVSTRGCKYDGTKTHEIGGKFSSSRFTFASHNKQTLLYLFFSFLTNDGCIAFLYTDNHFSFSTFRFLYTLEHRVSEECILKRQQGQSLQAHWHSQPYQLCIVIQLMIFSRPKILANATENKQQPRNSHSTSLNQLALLRECKHKFQNLASKYIRGTIGFCM